MSINFESSLRQRLRRGAPVWATLAAGVALSLGLFLLVRASERRATQAAVRAAATQRLELLRESLGGSLEALHSLGSFLTTGSAVDREHFRRYAAGALARRPEIQALSWTPRVPASERDVYEAAARADGFADFQFTERDPVTGRMIRARAQPEAYYPVYFIEPYERNRAALGFDLNARLETLTRARDGGAAIATPPIKIVQEPDEQPGFIVYLPLYRGAAPAGLAARRAELAGFVAAVFRIADLVRPALAHQPGLRVTLRDAGSDDAPVMYQAPGDDAPAATGLAPCVFALPLAGRSWEITFVPTTSFPAGGDGWQAWAALGAGLLLTGVIAGYLLSSLRRSAEIARTNAMLQREVADRKRAEEAAAAASRAKSDFLTSLSHEIRTPLNSILGYAQILERDRALPLRHRDAIASLANSGHHLLGLLNSILDLSKIEAGRMEQQRDVFDLPALVHGLADMFKPRCAEKRLVLRVACPAVGLIHVLGDEGKLRQVLINLIGNAVKFTPRGEVYIGVRAVEAPADHWLFEVIDTGIGLAPGEQAGLFAPFHQTVAGRRHGGTGLGLAIARGQVELLGGRLQVQSDPGTGTRFFFTLPLPAAVLAPVAAVAALPHLAPGLCVRALVIDDNSDNRVILARLLADIGCDVAKAATGAGARDIVRQAVPDIVFLDVLLTDTTGPELLAELHRDGLPAATPVLFHTATLLERAQREALRAHGADLLAKPFRIEDLCACLRRLPGVRFELPPASVEPVEPPLADLEQISLPEDLFTRMIVAAELHSTTVLKACLEELRQLGGPAVALADHLRQLLRAYDLAAIARLLHRVRVDPPTPAA